MSCRLLPSLFHLHISTLYEFCRAEVTVVYKVPLERKILIIELSCVARLGGEFLEHFRSKRLCLLPRSPLEGVIGLDTRHLS